MTLHPIRMLAFSAALVLVGAGAVRADDSASSGATTSAAETPTTTAAFTPSEFTLPVVAPEAGAPVLEERRGPVDRIWESVRYWPRSRPRYRDYGNNGSNGVVSQVHAGFFDPTGDLGTGFLAGFRLGALVDPHVQIGAAADWWHRSEDQTIDVSGGPGPGGIDTQRQIVLSSSSANLFPLMGYVQVGGDASMQVIPYVGAGAGYEWLDLNGDNPDGSSFDATYGGFGWQAWGGVAVPMSSQARFSAEVFGNGAELGRDVEDPTFGAVREIVKMNGVGMRFGLSWGF